jgi:hypothetical protein
MSGALTRKVPPTRELELFFGRDSAHRNTIAAQIPCIVTDAVPATWHHLNRNHSDSSISNFVPLSSELNQVIGGPKSEVRRAGFAYGMRPVPSTLEPEYLLRKADEHFRNWRDTDAYGCAHLAYWMAEWQGLDRPQLDIKFDCIMDAIKYARHAFHPTILEELLRRRLLPIVNRGAVATPEAARILMELTTQYAWVGSAEKSNTVAMQLNRLITGCEPLSSYDKRKRRIAQSVGVLFPKSKLAATLLAESAEAAERMDERADVMASEATIAITHVDPEKIKRLYERLHQRMVESDRFFHVKGAKPMNMTLNNAIAETWYFLLASLYLNKLDSAKQADEKLRILIFPENPAHRYISPATWPGSWATIMKDCRPSRLLDQSFMLLSQTTQSPPRCKLVKALDDVHVGISRLV